MPEWNLPPIDLLPHLKAPKPDVHEISTLLLRSLTELGAPCELERACVGPTTIQFELRPDFSTRMRDMTRLGRRDDLAFALAAESVRVQNPIPGKSLIGIEIPNPDRRTVGLREVVRHAAAPLRPALGVEPSGRVISLDLRALPHMAVAGASGGGKTTLLHTMLCSLLMRCTPEDVGLVLVDPKGGTEFSAYEGIPHLYGKPLTDTGESVRGLLWLAEEVRQRFALLQRNGVRTLEEYNVEAPEGRIPYALCVVDELADLMLSSKEQVETAVVRLGQLGRACGVHLILATQSPHATVFSGLIKANMVGRVACKVVSGVHSRVAIDQSGAELLLGKGDALLQDGTNVNLRRFQSAYVDTETIKAVCDHWRDQVRLPETELDGAQRGEAPGPEMTSMDVGESPAVSADIPDCRRIDIDPHPVFRRKRKSRAIVAA